MQEGRSDGLDLVELPLAIWHGWMFVNATGQAPPLERYVGALDGIVAPYRAEDLRAGANRTYDVAANWKIIVENYHECYHCPLIHPELCRVSPPSSGANWNLPGAWVGGRWTYARRPRRCRCPGARPGGYCRASTRVASST
jgi:Rieske 2Fe-2S family protein